jgi:hypothetical protein
MSTDPTHTDLLIPEKRSTGLTLIAAICALIITAIVFAGYTYLRRRAAQQRLALIAAQTSPSETPRGPAKVHIMVDDALLKGGQTIIGGTVRNISQEKLIGLSVVLELRRRKDGTLEQTEATVEPNELEPAQEGRYLLKLPAKEYLSVRLAGLKAGGDSAQLAYTTAPGQKRPPERLEPRVVTVPRSGSRGDGFLNSPDNPARVP